MHRIEDSSKIELKNLHDIYNNFPVEHELGGNMRDLRDLYNRTANLEYWIQRVHHDLDGTDKSDVLKLIQHMEDRERAALTITRCITALLLVRRQVGKPFKDVSKDDIRIFLRWMDLEKHYKASTNEKFRQVLKLFYKVVYGEGEFYPEQVKFFPTKVGKEKRASPELDTREYLDEEEVIKLIQSACSLQKKAFVACLYESGARPEEFLRLTNSDFISDTNGVVLILRGKTGERRVRIIAYAKLFLQWLDVHPLEHMPNYSIWISESTNFKNKPLGLRGAEKIIENLMPRILPRKHARLYILRHSRATHLANHLTESQLCEHFGWVQGSRVVRRYIHLTGRDVDRVLISLSNSGNASQTIEEFKIKPVKCTRCKEDIPPGNTFCGKCSLPTNLSKQYLKEVEIEEKNRMLESKIDTLERNMDEKLGKIMELIQRNPKLAWIKPDVLLKHIK